MDQVKSNSGQAVLEYILLLSIVISLFALMSKSLGNMNLVTNLTASFKKTYVYVYRYGNKDARGQDAGGPINIPQYNKADDTHNFRIFINPPINQ